MIVFYKYNVDAVIDDHGGNSICAEHTAPFNAWKVTEEGQWVMEHVTEGIKLAIDLEYQSWQHRVAVYGELSPQDETYYKLKWGVK